MIGNGISISSTKMRLFLLAVCFLVMLHHTTIGKPQDSLQPMEAVPVDNEPIAEATIQRNNKIKQKLGAKMKGTYQSFVVK